MAKKNANVVNYSTTAEKSSVVKVYRRSSAVPLSPTLYQTRTAKRLGRAIHEGLIDGISSNSARLVRGQFDDEFGKIDPVADAHQDPHLLAAAILNSEVARLTSDSKPDTNI